MKNDRTGIFPIRSFGFFEVADYLSEAITNAVS